MKQKVLILDFGSQYTQLIARRTRELGVYSEIAPYNIGLDQIKTAAPAAIIFSGGPASVYAPGAPRVDKAVLELGIPLLGICYGLHLLAYLAGLKVIPAKEREYGFARLKVLDNSGLLRNIAAGKQIWMSHGDKISEIPPDFHVTAQTENTDLAVIEAPSRKIYGVQFHPEVVHSEQGKEILANFLFHEAGLKADWTMSGFIAEAIPRLQRQIGTEQVILGLSGGVDSTTLALLLHRALGSQLHPVLIDNGLLRKNEFHDLMAMFTTALKLEVTGIDAARTFLTALRGVRSPEQKRKIIGKTFIDIFRTIEERIGPVKFFAQGTLYPDVIESVSVKGPSQVIKSHHNVGGLPKDLKWTLIEPFRELFKDEVRLVGRELGLDNAFLGRHPFPGPGLAVRILGAVSRPRLHKLQEADAILQEEMRRFAIYDKVWQAFVVLLPIKTVGVMGDERTYENAAVIRMVESVDGMTADWYPAPAEFLKRVASRIVNEVKGINRITYDLTSKPPGTIEWE